LEITYGQLIAMAQKSMGIDFLQLKEDCITLENTSSVSESIRKMIDRYKDCVMNEADDIEAKFASYVAPHFNLILSQ
jgi:hypothetical protein